MKFLHLAILQSMLLIASSRYSPKYLFKYIKPHSRIPESLPSYVIVPSSELDNPENEIQPEPELEPYPNSFMVKTIPPFVASDSIGQSNQGQSVFSLLSQLGAALAPRPVVVRDPILSFASSLPTLASGFFSYLNNYQNDPNPNQFNNNNNNNYFGSNQQNDPFGSGNNGVGTIQPSTFNGANNVQPSNNNNNFNPIQQDPNNGFNNNNNNNNLNNPNNQQPNNFNRFGNVNSFNNPQRPQQQDQYNNNNFNTQPQNTNNLNNPSNQQPVPNNRLNYANNLRNPQIGIYNRNTNPGGYSSLSSMQQPNGNGIYIEFRQQNGLQQQPLLSPVELVPVRRRPTFSRRPFTRSPLYTVIESPDQSMYRTNLAEDYVIPVVIEDNGKDDPERLSIYKLSPELVEIPLDALALLNKSEKESSIVSMSEDTDSFENENNEYSSGSSKEALTKAQLKRINTKLNLQN